MFAVHNLIFNVVNSEKGEGQFSHTFLILFFQRWDAVLDKHWGSLRSLAGEKVSWPRWDMTSVEEWRGNRNEKGESWSSRKPSESKDPTNKPEKVLP